MMARSRVARGRWVTAAVGFMRFDQPPLVKSTAALLERFSSDLAQITDGNSMSRERNCQLRILDHAGTDRCRRYCRFDRLINPRAARGISSRKPKNVTVRSSRPSLSGYDLARDPGKSNETDP